MRDYNMEAFVVGSMMLRKYGLKYLLDNEIDGEELNRRVKEMSNTELAKQWSDLCKKKSKG